MTANFGGPVHLRQFMRQRFLHGRHFGAWRARSGGRPAWQIVAASPLVPLLLFLRTGRSLASAGSPLGSLARAAIPFFLLAGAWAVGEAAGALTQRANP